MHNTIHFMMLENELKCYPFSNVKRERSEIPLGTGSESPGLTML